MKNLLPACLLLMSFNIYANECNVINDDIQTLLSWVVSVEREDNTKLILSDIAGYKIYYGNERDTYNCSLMIDDNTTVSYVINILENLDYYFVITTIDTDGRESKYSTVVHIPAQFTPSLIPNVVTNFNVFPVADKSGEYVFSWKLPTTTVTDVTLPDGAINKLFLFDNNKWVMDIRPGTTTNITLPVTVGDHLFEMEVETKLPDGTLIVSKRSEMIALVVEDLTLPIPPTPIEYDVQFNLPEGYRAEIIITPVN